MPDFVVAIGDTSFFMRSHTLARFMAIGSLAGEVESPERVIPRQVDLQSTTSDLSRMCRVVAAVTPMVVLL